MKNERKKGEMEWVEELWKVNIYKATIRHGSTGQKRPGQELGTRNKEKNQGQERWIRSTGKNQEFTRSDKKSK